MCIVNVRQRQTATHSKVSIARISGRISRVDLVHLARIFESAVRIDADLLVFVIDLAIGHVDPVRTTETLSQSVAELISNLLGLNDKVVGAQPGINLHRDLAESDGRATGESDAHD